MAMAMGMANRDRDGERMRMKMRMKIMMKIRASMAMAMMMVMGIGVLGCRGEVERGGIVRDTIGGVPSVMSPARGLLGDTVPWKLTQFLLVAGDQLYERKAAVFAMDVGILPNGNIVVLDTGNRRVLRFRSDGAYIGSFGSPGEEPGQFVTPLFLEVAGDRIYVLDSGLDRVTAFDTAGIFLSRFELDLAGLAGTMPLFIAGGPDEVYLAGEPVPFLEEARDTGEAVIYRVDGSGAIVDTLALFLPSNWVRLEVEEGRATFAKPRLAPAPRLSATPGAAALSTGARYMIEIRGPDGSLLRRVARQYENVVVTPEIRDSVLAELERLPNALPREALEQVPFAPVVPAVENLVMDYQGRLWVDVYADAATRWDIFDAEGQFLGPLFLPQPLELKDVGSERACGTIQEASGQSAVVCYHIETEG
jgi:hypothetical protein